MFISLVTCMDEACPNYKIEYRMVDATNPTVCGGCKADLVPELTDEVWEEPPFSVA